MHRSRTIILRFLPLLLFTAFFAPSALAYPSDYPVAPEPSTLSLVFGKTNEISSYVKGGISSLASVYKTAGKDTVSTYSSLPASFFSSVRQGLLNFLGFTDNDSPLTTIPSVFIGAASPPPSPATTTVYVTTYKDSSPSVIYPTYVTNQYVTEVRGGSTSGLARSTSRASRGQDDEVEALRSDIITLQSDLAAIDTALASTSLSLYDTDDLAEGTTNLYYTNARVNSLLSATTSLPNLATLRGLSSFGATGATTTAEGNFTVIGNLNFTGSFFQNGSPFQGSQWTTSGSDIYFNTGNVGIGTTTPSAKLSVAGDIIFNNSARMGDWVSSSGFNAISLNGSWDGANENILVGGPSAGNTTFYFNTNSGGSYSFSEGGLGSGNVALLGSALGIQVLEGSALTPTHSFINNPNTGMFLPAGSTLGFSTGGVERLRINNSGNVGIGTTTPGYPLTVGGAVNITDTLNFNGSSGSLGSVLQSNGVSAPTWVATSTLGFLSSSITSTLTNGFLPRWTGSAFTDSMFRGNGTSAGINASSSSYTLNIQGSAGINPLNVASSTGTSLVTVTNAGNVGIGTTTPTSRLDVYDTTLAGSGSLSGSILNLAQTWNTTGIPTAIKLNVTDTASNGASLLADLQVGGTSKFKVDKTGALTLASSVTGTSWVGTGGGRFGTKVALNEAGYSGDSNESSVNVGSAESYGFSSTVNAYNNTDTSISRASAGLIRFGTTKAGDAGGSISLTNITASGSYTQSGTSANTFTGTPTFSNATYSALFTGGNVGIGSTTPSEKLSVIGNGYFSGVLNTASIATSTFGGPVSVGNLSNIATDISNLVVNGISSSDVYMNITNTRGSTLGADNAGTGIKFITYGVSPSTAITAATIREVREGGATFNGSTNGSAGLAFSTYNNSLGERLRITGAGNVGIGTTTPTAKLDIYGTAGSSDIFAISSSSNSRLLTFTSTGRLGIGSSTPSAMLSILGAAGTSGAAPTVFDVLGGTGGSSGQGGGIVLTGGVGGSSGIGGDMRLTAGAGNGAAGGQIIITAGAAGSSGSGGAISITAGVGGSTGGGGAITIAGGATVNTGGNGGATNIRSGAGASTAIGGAILIKPGDEGSSASSNATLTIQGAGSGSSGNASGGTVTIQGGTASAGTAAAGGVLTLQGGTGGSSGGGTGAVGANVNITGGTGGSGSTSGGGGNVYIYGGAPNSGSNYGNLILGRTSGGTTQGLVGVNVLTPGYQFDVATSGAGTLTIARFQNSIAAATSSASQIVFGANRLTGGITDFAGISGIATNISSASYTGALVFSTANAGAIAERARFDNTGQLGIGTTTPSEQLSLSGRFYVAGTGTSTIENNLNVKGTLKIGTGSININNDQIASGNGALTLSSIATSTITNTTVLAGRVLMTGLSTDSSTIGLPGVFCLDSNNEIKKLLGVSTCIVSSRRFKENIDDLDHGLDWVTAMRPVTFDYKANGDHSLGFIAEEMDVISPLLTARDGTGKIFTVRYELITSVLTKAVQEIWKKIAPVLSWFSDNGDTFKIQGEVCVDDVCVTKEEFKAMLQGAGGHGTTPTPSGEGDGGNDDGGGNDGGDIEIPPIEDTGGAPPEDGNTEPDGVSDEGQDEGSEPALDPIPSSSEGDSGASE